MESTDERSHEINHLHYDHCYAKNIIIGCINDDCLAEIFTYVPICERPKIALVCKKWKRALDNSWFNVKKIELTYWRYHEYSNCLNKFQTSDEQFNFLKSLLDKCGRYLTELDLTAYGYCDIVPVVKNSCQNLVKLRLRFICIDEAKLYYGFEGLSKLKSLTIVFENMKGKEIPLTLITALSSIVDTLVELNLLHFTDHYDDFCNYPRVFSLVIPLLKAIKILEFAGIRVTNEMFQQVVANKLEFYFNHNSYLRKPPHSGQAFINIKALDLKLNYIKDDGLYTIANTIEQLESLEITCNFITDYGVIVLTKMTNLQNISLTGSSTITDSSIKFLKNIVKIVLPRSKKITDVSLRKLIENSPKIRCLFLQDTSVTVELIKKAEEISNNRKQLLTIIMNSVLPNVKQSQSPYFKIFPVENTEYMLKVLT